MSFKAGMKKNDIAWTEKLQSIAEDFKATGSITETNGSMYLDSKEAGTIIRAIGIYPTEAQIHELLKEARVPL